MMHPMDAPEQRSGMHQAVDPIIGKGLGDQRQTKDRGPRQRKILRQSNVQTVAEYGGADIDQRKQTSAKIKTDVRPKFVSRRRSLPASGTASPRAKTDSATARMANQPSKASAVRL